MKREPGFFEDQELVLVYIARKLREALKIEALLTGMAFDYLVEADRYTGGIVFRTERVGAFFYVAPGMAEAARQLLIDHGYHPNEPLTKDGPPR
jgi:hypothetical protein